MANVTKFKGTDKWKSFVFNNNNLGNKLRGVLYVKVNEKKCQLTVTDNYVTIYNGKKREDSNPNGTNAFVKNELGDLLWDHCTESANLIALDTAEFPKDPKNAGHMGKWGVNQDVNFWYLGADAMAAPEGCSYNFDTWVDGQPLKKGNTSNPHLEGTRGAHLALRPQVDRSSSPACRRYHGSEQGLRGQSEIDQVSCAAVLIQ